MEYSKRSIMKGHSFESILGKEIFNFTAFITLLNNDSDNCFRIKIEII